MKTKILANRLKGQRVKRLSFIFLSFYLLTSLNPAFADDKKSVEQSIRSSVNTVLDIIRNKELNKETKKERVMVVIDKLFDIPLIAKLTLGRKHWPKLDEPQRKEFIRLFIKALQDSYFDKMDLLTDEVVEFDPPVQNDKKYTMSTYIVSKGKRYEILYKLYKEKNLWRVYDVEIEGISFVKSYSAQYDQFLQTYTVQKLLDKMREKTMEVPKELKSKEKENKAEPSKEKPAP